MTVLVVTAVAAERDAAAARLGAVPDTSLPYAAVVAGDVIVAAGGVGPVAAAVATSRLLSLRPFDLVISAGIAGGFSGRAAIGDVVVAKTSTFADLGAGTDDGFLDLAGLGLSGGAPLWAVGPSLPEARVGTVLTVATMTGTDARAAALAAAHPDAVAEAMEGYGVAWAATEHGVPWAEVRTVSNLIGRRNPSTWNFPAAFDALGVAVEAIVR